MLDPDAVVVINFRDSETGLPSVEDGAFLDAVATLVDEEGQTLGITEVDKFGSEGEYGPIHDWGGDPNGVGIRNSAPLAGRPALQAWLDNRREAFEAVIQRYSGGEFQQRQEEVAATSIGHRLDFRLDGAHRPSECHPFLTGLAGLGFFGWRRSKAGAI